MTINSKDIFDKAQFNEGEVSVPTWSDEPIKIRELNARQTANVLSKVELDPIRSNAMAVVFGCINDSGKRIFTDNQVDKLLDTLRVQDISTVATAIMQLSDLQGIEGK